MADRRDILGSLPMSRLFLPGTHDSASYAIHERAKSENLIEKYVITQVITRSRLVGDRSRGRVEQLEITLGRDKNELWSNRR